MHALPDRTVSAHQCERASCLSVTMVEASSPAGRGVWRGQPLTVRRDVPAFAVNAKAPSPPYRMFGTDYPVGGGAAACGASTPAAAEGLRRTGRETAAPRSLPRDGVSCRDESRLRRRRVRARAGETLCMTAQQQQEPQQRNRGRRRLVPAAAVGVAAGASDYKRVEAQVSACEAGGECLLYVSCMPPIMEGFVHDALAC